MKCYPRLDVLIYAHDGRGLGHISRSISIGLAIRRLFPNLKVAIITGSHYAQMLINYLPLEIIKIPSYVVNVYNGNSHGAISHLNYTDQQLAGLRSLLLKTFIDQTNPKCILVDHLPLGKREELQITIQSGHSNCIWIFGIRAVYGYIDHIDRIKNELLNIYSHIFWYGDSRIISTDNIISHLPLRSKINIEEIGYISRAYELEKWNSIVRINQKRSFCVVSFSWISEHTLSILKIIVTLLEKVKNKWGNWFFFIGHDYSGGKASQYISLINSMPFCNVDFLRNNYLNILANSKFAIVAGGYNTLTDLLWSKTPSVVIVRSMVEKEQEIHVKKISNVCNGLIELMLDYEVSISKLEAAIHKVTMFHNFDTNIDNIVISGSENAAKKIAKILGIANTNGKE